MKLEQLKTAITDTFKDSDLEPLDFLHDSDLQEFIDDNEEDTDGIVNDFRDNLVEQQGFLDEDVIYYSVAIEYLKENDPSLRESLEIAAEYGYELQNLNSETLASLLKSQNNREEFQDLIEVLEVKLDAIS